MSTTSKPSRRRFIAGAAAAPAALAGVALLPKAGAPIAAKAAEPASGYRLTEHVQRYYDTTRS
jgi:hypothetical protein